MTNDLNNLVDSKRSISILSADVYAKTAAERQEQLADGSEMPTILITDNNWEGVQHDDFANTNHLGNEYGEILFDEGTEYEKRARAFTKEGLDEAMRKRYKVMAPPSDSDEVSSLYSGGEVDYMLQTLLDNSKSKPVINNSVIRFHRSSDPLRQTLSKLPPFGNTSTYLSDGSILVLCGRHSTETCLGTNTIMEYHIASKVWSVSFAIQKTIVPRFDHVVSLIKTPQKDTNRTHTKFILFGGKNGNSILNDMYEITAEDVRNIESDGNSGMSISNRKISVKSIITTDSSEGRGPLPALCCHTMDSVPSESVLLIFGGMRKDGDCSSSLLVFDTTTQTTLRPTLVGEVPTKRCGHSSALNEQSSILYIFGGKTLVPHFAASEHLLNDLYEINLTTNICSQVIVTSLGGVVPLPRWRHSCHEKDGVLYIISGETEVNEYNHGIINDQNQHLFEMYVVHLNEGAYWSLKKFPLSASQPAVVSHSSVLVGSDIFIVGGITTHQMSVNRCGIKSVPLSLTLKDICSLYILENKIFSPPPRQVQKLKRNPPGRRRTRAP